MSALNNIQDVSTFRLAELELLCERLAMFADDTERSGFPYVASHIRGLIQVVLAESDLAASIGA
jgi:hypothetical protein